MFLEKPGSRDQNLDLSNTAFIEKQKQKRKKKL